MNKEQFGGKNFRKKVPIQTETEPDREKKFIFHHHSHL